MAEVVTGFCMKCKQSRVIENPARTTMSNGRIRVSGKCSAEGLYGIHIKNHILVRTSRRIIHLGE